MKGKIVSFKKVTEVSGGIHLTKTFKRGVFGFGVALGAHKESDDAPSIDECRALLAECGFFLGDHIQEFFGEEKTQAFLVFSNKKYDDLLEADAKLGKERG